MSNTKYFIQAVVIIALLGLAACNNSSPKPEYPSEEVAEVLEESTAFERDTVRKDALKVSKNYNTNSRDINWYTYNYILADGKEIEIPPMEIEQSSTDKVTSNTKEKVKIEAPRSVYMANKTDRPPLYDIICLTESDPEKCSNEGIEAFIKEEINYPNNAITKGHDGLEMVTFVVDETGTIEDDIEVLSKESPCMGCAKAAVEVVSKMEKWTPAIRNGKPVRSRVTLPIRFETKIN
ncbi:MAG: energy transducer TonB [Bacteroidota bacterium]